MSDEGRNIQRLKRREYNSQDNHTVQNIKVHNKTDV